MQELIEMLKIHRDTAFEKSRMYESEHYHSRGQAFNDAISFAELQLEKEKEVIEKAWWAGCDEGASDHKIYPSEDCNGYYNETFKTKRNET